MRERGKGKRKEGVLLTMGIGVPRTGPILPEIARRLWRLCETQRGGFHDVPLFFLPKTGVDFDLFS